MPIRFRTAIARTAAMAVALAAACAAQAAPLSAPARTEVDALLARLQASGCQFNRNGSWYSGADAKSHLLRKLEYLEKKDLVKSADCERDSRRQSEQISRRFRCESAWYSRIQRIR